MDEDSDELEIGEITERDSPDRITRPPNDELIEYDRGNKINEGSSLGGVIAGGIGEVQYGRSKRVYALYIVIAILCVSTIFLYSEVNDLETRISCINQSLTEKIVKLDSNRIDELKSDLGKLLPPRCTGTVSLNESVYNINDTATVTVVDTDMNYKTGRSEKVNVVVRNTNTSEQISLTLTLTETGRDTGIFAETFTLANETNNMERIIEVRINDTIEVLYEDEKTEGNKQETRTATAIIKQEEP